MKTQTTSHPLRRAVLVALAAAPLALAAPAPAVAQFPDESPADCPEVPGLSPLLEPGTVLLVGEMHGTEQAPAFVRAVACRALAEALPVTVGLEIDRADDAVFQEFLRSDGSAAARERLLTAPFWHRSSQDGRSSRAMMDLMDGLREIASSGALRVVLIDRPRPPGERDRAMAESVAQAVGARPGDLFVVLTGNIHNRLTKGMPWNDRLEPMGYRLRRMQPEARLVSLDMAYPGGTAWVCFGADCKAQEIEGSSSAEGRRGVELFEAPDGRPYSGRYFTGPLSASEPAVPAAGDPAEATLDDLAWFAGTWAGTIGDHPVEEAWLEPAGGAMAGVFRWIQDGEVYLYEFVAIRPDPAGEGLILEIKHFGPDLHGWEAPDESVVFDLVEMSEGRAVFVQRGDPARLIYRLDGPDRLTVALETERDGEPAVLEFHYTRR